MLKTLLFIFLQKTNDAIEMADIFRQNGKIYVVVGTVLILFLGFFFYIISLDRKIKKLEKRIKDISK